ncbi:hypothetical protein R6M67_47290, partial [Streptomyces sp. Wh19]|nr:hypothetical protein [Streptomyces sp. Wh19]
MGAGAQQPGQRLVVPGPESFGERPRWCGHPHPSHGSRSGQARGRYRRCRAVEGNDRVGIESDQLVYDYLSRVGDLAQQQQLSSAARMRLVSTLRGEIDRQRGKQSGDSPAAVRRIIGRLGEPDELVAAAAASGDGTVEIAGRPEPAPEEGRGIPRPR